MMAAPARVAGIDGLRGLAALAVLAAHVGAYVDAPGSPPVLLNLLAFGNQGLSAFFVISGFVLYRPYAAAIIAGRPLPPIRSYAAARLLRIYPAYLVVLTVAFALGVTTRYGVLALHPRGDVGPITDPVVLLADVLLVQNLVPGMIATGLVPAWSLTAELCFYAVLPLLAAAAVVSARRSPAAVAGLMPAALLLIVGLATSVGLAVGSTHLTLLEHAQWSWGATGTAVIERSLLAQAALFGLGMLAAWWKELDLERPSGPARLAGHLVAIIAMLLGTAGGTVAVAVLGPGVGVWTGYAAAHAVGLATAAEIVLLASAPTRRASMSSSLLETEPLRRLGGMSYGVYLWHMPVITWLTVHGVGLEARGLPVVLLVVAGITLALAVPTHYFIERPALRLRRSLMRAPARTNAVGFPTAAAVHGE